VKQAHKDLLLKVAGIVRQTKRERDFVIDELAVHMHKESASTVAKDLVQRGVYTPEELDQTVEKVSKLKHLGSLKEALAIIQPKKDLPIGEVEKVASVGTRGEISDAERKLLEDPAIQFLMEHA
jgi:hypothetical protein